MRRSDWAEPRRAPSPAPFLIAPMAADAGSCRQDEDVPSLHRRPTLSRLLSKSQREAIGRLRINMGKARPMDTEAQSRTEFKTNLGLAMRTGLGVLIASAFVTKAAGEHTPARPNIWVCFPEWYILGGINFIAVACVFAAGRNIGATLREVFQQKLGVFLAFAFNAALFHCFQPQLFYSDAEVQAAVQDGTLLRITASFSGTPYYVNNGDVLTVLPFMMAFNAFILLLPFEAGTKKFSMVNNLIFALTVVSPNDYSDPSKLKDAAHGLYASPMIVKNLFIYMWLGLIGAFLSFLVVWVPYPIFAIRKLQAQTLSAADTIHDLLHLVVDAYCFKKKNVEHMHFLRTKIKRKFELAALQKDAMTGLLNDAWWEQILGLAPLLGFQKTITKPYIDLYASLLDTLRAMNQALQLEHYDRLHTSFMAALQQDVCGVQVRAIALLREISLQVHANHTDLQLTQLRTLQAEMEALLVRFQATQTKLFLTMHPTPSDVEGNIPLNLFLFGLQSLCATMAEFPAKVRNETHHTPSRILNFLKRSFWSFVDPRKLSSTRFQIAFKVWLALLLSSLLAVYVFGFSSTAPTTIAYVMGNQIGGSFGISLFRAVGVVAGVIVPSIALFFVCTYSGEHTAGMLLLRNLFFFVWTTASMYVKWKGGLDSYAGLVSAFIAAGILLPDDICPAPGSLSSYANVVQMTLGVLLIVGIELLFWPESAYKLLRRNVRTHLTLCEGAFTALVEHTLLRDGAIDSAHLAAVKAALQTTAPSRLNDQRILLKEALFEPRLWRPAFSQPKYTAIVEGCQRLLTNTTILFQLVEWFQRRHASIASYDFSTLELVPSIHETFETLHTLFGARFQFADADQTALFVQMKEAFQIADKQCSGFVDASDVKALLLHVFEQSGVLPMDAVDDYVADFMEIVNQDKSGHVSLDEFMRALENGLLLEVEVLPPQRSGRPLSATRLQEISVGGSPLLTPSARIPHVVDDGVCRAHDILDVETFSLLHAADAMRRSYASWLLQDDRYKGLALEELLLLNSLVSGVSGLARNLALLEETVVQP